MKILSILSTAQSLGIKLWVEDNRLRFSAPKGALTDEFRDQLKEFKSELIEYLSFHHKENSIPLVAHNGDEGPLALAQQRLWAVEQLAPGTTAYTMPVVIALEGPLHRAALNAAFTLVQERHGALRTRIVMRDGLPWQSVAADTVAQVGYVQVTDTPAAEEWVQTLLATPFDLATGPLVRATVLEQAAGTCWLVFTVHHVVCDGWSLALVLRDWGACYAALVSGNPVSLPALTVSYLDVALWQRQLLAGVALEQLRSAWQQALAGAPLVVRLPTDYPRPAVQSFAGARVAVTVPDELGAAVAALAQRTGVTPFMVFLAAWGLVLHQYSGQADLVIGVPVTQRDHEAVQQVVGLFANTVPLRLQLQGRMTVQELLVQVRDHTMHALERQLLPFEAIVDLLQPERDPSLPPLAQVFFAWQDAPIKDIESSTLKWKPLPIEQKTSRVDMTLVMGQDDAGAYSGALEYATALFTDATAQQYAAVFIHALTALVADVQQPLGSLSLVPSLHRATLATWMGSVDTSQLSPTVPAAFAAQVAQTPDACALRDADTRWTYAALDALTNQLAHWLQHTYGVQHEVPVALAFPRSAWEVIATLAVLKAGGTYVPLDLSFPASRIAALVAQTRPVVVVCGAADMAALAEVTTVPQVVVAATTAQQWADWATTPVVCPATADSRAYIMFTSGSTGVPKGVQVTHQNIVRLVEHTSYMRFTPTDVVLHFAPTAFDAATLELWGPLLNGATLAVAPPGILGIDELAAVLAAEQVQVLWLTSGMFQQAVHAQPTMFAGVRVLISGGDVVPLAVVDALRAAGFAGTFMNGYGPTENTTFSTTYAVLPTTQVDGSVPIGRPIDQTTVQVVDSWGRLVPIGAVGELLVGGAGVTRGYLDDPRMTGERFLPGTDGQRWYRTGDQVRWRTEGVLEFHGRTDAQVKIRGFRVDLSEVEAVLLRMEKVEEAVVLVEDGPTGRRLVGYVVSAEEDGTAIRHALQAQVAEYHVPQRVVVVAAMPLTRNGKVDRQALAAYGATVVEADDVHEAELAAWTAVERCLAELWEGVVGTAVTCRTAHFFRLGGDSIGAIQVSARAKHMGLQLSPQDVFRYPELGLLARVVSERAGRAMVAEQTAEGTHALSPMQAWFFRLALAVREHWNQSVVLHSEERPEASALAAAVTAVVAQHAGLRTCFREHAPGVWGAEIVAAVESEVRWHSGVPAAAVEEVLTADQGSLCLETGEVVRVSVVEVEGAHGALVQVAIHHLVVDGVSWRVLLEDLDRAYGQAVRGEEIQVVRGGSEVRTWVAHLLAQREAVAAAEGPYWDAVAQARVDGVPLAGQVGQEGSSVRVQGQLDAVTTAGLQERSQAAGVSMTAVLVSAVEEMLYGWTGGKRQRVHVEGHGRELETEQVDMTELVAWCTSLYPVVLEWSGGAWGQRVRRVTEQVGGVPAGGRHYELLCSMDGGAARWEVAHEVSVNYLGEFDQTVGGLEQFRVAEGWSGQEIAAENKRVFGVDVLGLVEGGCLQVAVTASSEQLGADMVATLHATLMQALTGIYDALLSDDMTEEDKPESADHNNTDIFDWNQNDLDSIKAAIGNTLKGA